MLLLQLLMLLKHFTERSMIHEKIFFTDCFSNRLLVNNLVNTIEAKASLSHTNWML